MLITRWGERDLVTGQVRPAEAAAGPTGKRVHRHHRRHGKRRIEVWKSLIGAGRPLPANPSPGRGQPVGVDHEQDEFGWGNVAVEPVQNTAELFERAGVYEPLLGGGPPAGRTGVPPGPQRGLPFAAVGDV